VTGSDSRTAEFAHLRQVAEEAARAAGAVARHYFRQAPPAERKSDGSLVTIADREAERAARAIIARAYPEHRIVGEEYGAGDSADLRGLPGGSQSAAGSDATGPARAPLWWIDPIDGTHNFVRGNHLFAALIAVEIEGEIVAGAAYNPILAELTSAHRGGGCTRDGERVRVSAIADLADAQLVHGGFLWLEQHPQGPRFMDLARRCWRTRGFGDYFGHALVAAGHAEIMVESKVMPWDIAALQVIVEEAGGAFSDMRGARTIHGGSAVSSNGLLHSAVIEILNLGDSGPEPTPLPRRGASPRA